MPDLTPEELLRMKQMGMGVQNTLTPNDAPPPQEDPYAGKSPLGSSPEDLAKLEHLRRIAQGGQSMEDVQNAPPPLSLEELKAKNDAALQNFVPPTTPAQNPRFNNMQQRMGFSR